MMRKVYASDNLAMLGYVRSMLEEHAIGFIVRNDFLAGAAGELPVNETWPEIWVVDERDAERALSLIETIVASPPSAPDWRCPKCSRRIEGQFTDCWHCAADES
ncbi:putative signal transducing protein [Thioalkalivibrio sp. HK1]|uniref:putative signal transducing protein n=1 Tax=Thioalkalivibrio sp. HK1 TaxID=1469245 RepID=UPI0004B25F93|nr:DUF2007 domain-containing protein [Thioalkalivibrio sp. HK1]